MKNKCEICRCLLFEADVWWVLPKSNQLFPWGSSPYSVTPEQLRNMKRWSDSTLWNCEEDFVLRGLCYGKIKTELSQSSLVEDTGYRAVFFFFFWQSLIKMATVELSFAIVRSRKAFYRKCLGPRILFWRRNLLFAYPRDLIVPWNMKLSHRHDTYICRSYIQMSN